MFRALAFSFAAILALCIVGGTVWYFTPPPTTPTSPSERVSLAVPPGAVSVQQSRPQDVKLPAGMQIRFREVTREAGIDFRHFDGRTDKEYIMDQTGSGLAWLDYDQDGLLDLFLVQGYTFVPPYPSATPTCKLYKNLGGGKFRDVTREVGLERVGCGQGVAVGDIDNSGYPSLFVTYFGKPN